MAATTVVAPTHPIRVPRFAWALVPVALAAAYVMFQENGAVLAASWETVHELFHDGRHLIGVPCH